MRGWFALLQGCDLVVLNMEWSLNCRMIVNVYGCCAGFRVIVMLLLEVRWSARVAGDVGVMMVGSGPSGPVALRVRPEGQLWIRGVTMYPSLLTIQASGASMGHCWRGLVVSPSGPGSGCV